MAISGIIKERVNGTVHARCAGQASESKKKRRLEEMSEEKQVYTRFTCRRCKQNTSVEGGGFLGLVSRPPGWEKIGGLLLCGNCVKDYNLAFSAFMRAGKQKQNQDKKPKRKPKRK